MDSAIHLQIIGYHWRIPLSHTIKPPPPEGIGTLTKRKPFQLTTICFMLWKKHIQIRYFNNTAQINYRLVYFRKAFVFENSNMNFKHWKFKHFINWGKVIHYNSSHCSYLAYKSLYENGGLQFSKFLLQACIYGGFISFYVTFIKNAHVVHLMISSLGDGIIYYGSQCFGIPHPFSLEDLKSNSVDE